jgi:hypothetical protein
MFVFIYSLKENTSHLSDISCPHGDKYEDDSFLGYMMEAVRTSETSAYFKSTKRYIAQSCSIQYISVTKSNCLLFKEIIPVYSDNHTKTVNTGQNAVIG